MRRRSFLKIGGAGVAALASRRSWADWLVPAELSSRTKPANPVVLSSSNLEVVLDGKEGLPFEYRLLPGNARIRGEDLGEAMRVTVCNRSWDFMSLPITASSVRTGKTQADFHFQVRDNSTAAASFVVRYLLSGATLYVTLQEVREEDGYELIEVVMPRLATVREEDGAAWLAHGDDGGNLAMLSEAKPGHLPPNTFWGNVLAGLPVVMLGTDRAICVQEVTAYMDGTELSVAGENGHRRASLGTVKTYRVNGSLCYDMNTGGGTARNCGNQKTPNLLIEQKSSCRLDFIAADSGKPLDWLAGAKLVRQRMPAIPTHYYDDKFVCGIHCDEPKWEKPGATFKQSEELIGKVSSLIDGWPQVAHLWGWQYRGKDSGYPAVAEVNQRLGGYDDLMHLMAEARKYHCNATFSDNYDDAYRSSPAWDPAIIARRPDGELWQSRNWTGEDSYIVGLAKYMNGPGGDRVRYTCQRYKLRESTHVDVLSYYSIRNDWDPAQPASGIQNLRARYKVVDEFAKYGVDVSSEAMRYAFIGKISFYWHMPSVRACPFGGKPIPLMSAIYRRSAVWGEWGRNRGHLERIMNMLFYDACPHLSIGNSFNPSDITDIFYLMTLPWFKLRNRNIEWFRREQERTSIGLEGDSRIDLDWNNKTYSLVVDGVEVARNGSTFCPLDQDRMAFYSLIAQDLSAPLPRGWNPSTMGAVALSTDNRKQFNIAVESGKIKVSVPAQRPLIVYRDEKTRANVTCSTKLRPQRESYRRRSVELG